MPSESVVVGATNSASCSGSQVGVTGPTSRHRASSQSCRPCVETWRMSATILRVPRRQHTVSRVVLRSFTWDNKISVFDRQRDLIHAIGPGGAFYVENFEQHDAVVAEERWGRVE